MDSLNEFKDCSGLVPSAAKSTVFFCGVKDHTKRAILSIMPFEEGHLPVRYLGVPLISTRLIYQDCRVLLERIEKRIDDWKTKFLSFAGRLQLIKSVLYSLHIYWASVFILPSRIIHELEQRMRNFLWSRGNDAKVRPKVSWKSICIPKYEGGLGIRRIGDSNKALIAGHIWSIISHRKSLWVDWVHCYKLRGDSFWDIAPQQSMSWGWRKLLNLRVLVRPHVISRIGNGLSTNAWSDTWSKVGPLRSFITPRQIANAGFTIRSTVADVVADGNWKWPQAWHDLFPVLNTIQIPTIVANCNDKLLWYDNNGVECQYASSTTWHTIRTRLDEVDWTSMVWFPHCIPRHAFHMWLLFRNKLRTQDRLKAWDVGSLTNLGLMCCSLCNNGIDSRHHLFFECPFARQVWNEVRGKAYLDHIDGRWESIVNWLKPTSAKNSAKSVIGRMVLAASTYYVWHERNLRLFKSSNRSKDQVVDLIVTNVRWRLVTFRFKDNLRTRKVLQDWSIPLDALQNGEDDYG